MVENGVSTTNNHEGYDGKGLKGALWTLAGVSIGALATGSGFLGGNGGLGNIFGGCNTATIAANAAAQAAQSIIAQKDSQIAKLESERYTDSIGIELYKQLTKQDKEQDAVTKGIDSRLSALETAAPLREQILEAKITNVANTSASGLNLLGVTVNNLQNVVNGIVKCVVPNSSVCPGWGAVKITPEVTTTTPTTNG